MKKKSDKSSKQRVPVRMVSVIRETAGYQVLPETASLLRECAKGVQSEGLRSDKFRRAHDRLNVHLCRIGAGAVFSRDLKRLFVEEGGSLTIGKVPYHLLKKASDETADTVFLVAVAKPLGTSAETTAMA